MKEVISVETARDITNEAKANIMNDRMISAINDTISFACKRGESKCNINVSHYGCKTYADACEIAQRLGKLGYNTEVKIEGFRKNIIEIDWSDDDE